MYHVSGNNDAKYKLNGREYDENGAEELVLKMLGSFVQQHDRKREREGNLAHLRQDVVGSMQVRFRIRESHHHPSRDHNAGENFVRAIKVEHENGPAENHGHHKDEHLPPPALSIIVGIPF